MERIQSKPTMAKRRRVVWAACLSLSLCVAGCLSPVPSYQKTDLETSAADLRHVGVALIAERQGQMLRGLLEQRLATAGKQRKKTHELEVALDIHNDERDFGRARIVGETRARVRFVLRETQANKRVLLEGRMTERSNYTVKSKFLARRDAEEESLRHVLALVADEMLVRLRLYFFTTAAQQRETKKDDKKGDKKGDKKDDKKESP